VEVGGVQEVRAAASPMAEGVVDGPVVPWKPTSAVPESIPKGGEWVPDPRVPTVIAPVLEAKMTRRGGVRAVGHEKSVEVPGHDRLVRC